MYFSKGVHHFSILTKTKPNRTLQESETRKKQEKAMRTQSANKSKSAQLRQMRVTESFVEKRNKLTDSNLE